MMLAAQMAHRSILEGNVTKFGATSAHPRSWPASNDSDSDSSDGDTSDDDDEFGFTGTQHGSQVIIFAIHYVRI